MQSRNCLCCWIGFVFRKKALLFNNVVAMVAALVMLFSRIAGSFEMILLGRFLYGYNVGMFRLRNDYILGWKLNFRGKVWIERKIQLGLGLGLDCTKEWQEWTSVKSPHKDSDTLRLSLSGLRSCLQLFSTSCFTSQVLAWVCISCMSGSVLRCTSEVFWRSHPLFSLDWEKSWVK